MTSQMFKRFLALAERSRGKKKEKLYTGHFIYSNHRRYQRSGYLIQSVFLIFFS